MKARLRPCDVISRRTMSSLPSSVSKIASTVARSSPVRIRSCVARPPSNSPTASTRMDLPAPVSPVRMLNDCSKSTATDSITARLRMARNRIMRFLQKRGKCHRIIALTEFPMACYGCTNGRSPSSAHPNGMDSEGLLPTPGLLLALQLEDGSAPTRAAAADFIDLVLAASPVVKVVMALLLIFSVISWGIILYKWWAYRGIEKHTATFLEVFQIGRAHV